MDAELRNEAREGKTPGIIRIGEVKGVGHPAPTARAVLEQTGFRQRLEGPIFVNGLQAAGAHADPDEFAELGNPYALLTKIGLELTLHGAGDVTTDTALFLGTSTAVDFLARDDFSTGDFTNSRHLSDPLKGSMCSVSERKTFGVGYELQGGQCPH
jgi:hypothetical protein